MDLQETYWCRTCRMLNKTTQDGSLLCPVCESNLDLVRYRLDSTRFNRLIAAVMLAVQFIFIGGHLLGKIALRTIFSGPLLNPLESEIYPIQLTISSSLFLIGVILLSRFRHSDERIITFDEGSQEMMGSDPISFRDEIISVSAIGFILSLILSAGISLIALLVVWVR